LALIEIIGLIVLIILAGLASSGGFGGGVILTPTLLMFFDYAESDAITIVYAIILGGSIGNFMNIGLKRDPKTKKPFLSYDLALICMPPMLLGTTIGVIANRTLATVILVTGLIILIAYTTQKIYVRSMKEYKKESEEKAGQAAKEEVATSITESFISNEPINNDTSYNEAVDDRLEKILKEEDQLIPWKKMAKVIALLIFMMIMALLRGTNSFASIIDAPYCGIEYWLLFAATMVGCMIFSLFNILSVRSNLRIKDAAGYVAKEKGFVLQEKHVGKLSILSLIAGVLAGMFGIGGGFIMGPILLTLGLSPQGLSATSGFFIIQTAFISFFSAVLYGTVPLINAGFFFITVFIGAYGVSYVLNYTVKKLQRPSLVLFTLIFVLIISFVATPTFEIVSNIHDLKALLAFTPIC